DFRISVNSVNYGQETITAIEHNIPTGTPVKVSGILPEGLDSQTEYFAIAIDGNTIALAISASNASLGIKIPFAFKENLLFYIDPQTNLGSVIGNKTKKIFGKELKNG